VPHGVAARDAGLAAPFPVSLPAATRHPPSAGGRAVVYGAGALGTTTTAILRALYPEVDVVTVARFEGQAEVVRSLGARVLAPEPREELVAQLAAWPGGVLRRPWQGLPFAHPGHVDGVCDTLVKPETLAICIR